MQAMVDLPLALRPVIQTVMPFWFSSFSRSPRETAPSCQVMLVAFTAVDIGASLSKKISKIESILFKQWRAQIALADAGHDCHDHFSLVFRARRDFRRCRH